MQNVINLTRDISAVYHHRYTWFAVMCQEIFHRCEFVPAADADRRAVNNYSPTPAAAT